jgi:hypothetical protein
MVDSQSAKTTGVGGEARATTVGRRFVAESVISWWDTEGLVLKAKVHSAKYQIRTG